MSTYDNHFGHVNIVIDLIHYTHHKILNSAEARCGILNTNVITDHTLTEDLVTKSKEFTSEIVQYVENNCEDDDNAIKTLKVALAKFMAELFACCAIFIQKYWSGARTPCVCD